MIAAPGLAGTLLTGEPVPSCISPSVIDLHAPLQITAENEKGLLFKNKRDRKVINVDPNAVPGDNSTRTEVPTDEYIQAVIYDHVTRRRA